MIWLYEVNSPTCAVQAGSSTQLLGGAPSGTHFKTERCCQPLPVWKHLISTQITIYCTFLNIYILKRKINFLRRWSPTHLTVFSKVYNIYKKKSINTIMNSSISSHLFDALVPVAEGLCVPCKAHCKSLRSFLLGRWKIRAPAKWNTPFGFHWERFENQPRCWRGTRGLLLAALLWLLGFDRSLFCCRWIGPLSPKQTQWQRSPQQSPLKRT